jgi:hypothetical protein
MRTPAGKECPHYYQDFNRGRNVQECRLIRTNPASLSWQPGDCAQCPIPDILNANASRYLELKLTKKPKFLGLGRKLEVTASCALHQIPIKDPYVGCTRCNEERPGLDVFWKALQQDGDEQ